MKLFLATGNKHKVEELKAMIADSRLSVEALPASAIGGMPDVVEDQETFTGNALKKARALAALAPEGAWALADDSGLCVDALDGAPGVYSARYAGEGASDEENLQKLLREMSGLDASRRGAEFRCHLALVARSGEEHVFEGKCRGRIIEQRRGEGGFGYDPIFTPEGEERSFAELSEKEKAEISHRGDAMETFIAWLRWRSEA